MHEKMKKICEMKDKLADLAESQISMNLQGVNTEELGEVIDMIKDLAEVEEKCVKACYYEALMDEMGHEPEEEPFHMKRMGYNNRRYASGRYAPKGRGRVMGYMPDMDMPFMSGMMYDPEFMDPMGIMGYPMGGGRYTGAGAARNQTGPMITGRSGYPDNGQNGNNGERSGYLKWGQRDSRYGKAYNDYQDARRHYTETGSVADKESMSMHAREHVNDTIATMRELWKTSDPDLKKRIKADFTNLLNEMTI